MRGKKAKSEEEKRLERRIKDRLRKRRQREREKREQEIQEDFLGVAKDHIPQLQKPKGKNPDHIKKCSQCGHLIPFCNCPRDERGNLIESGDWLRYGA